MTTEETVDKIFLKLDTLSEDVSTVKGDVRVIAEKIEHKIDKADYLLDVDERTKAAVDAHNAACLGPRKTRRSATGAELGLFDSGFDKRRKKSDVKITISGLPTSVRYVLYVAVPSLVGLVTYLIENGVF